MEVEYKFRKESKYRCSVLNRDDLPELETEGQRAYKQLKNNHEKVRYGVIK